jgi:hypothetical protein
MAAANRFVSICAWTGALLLAPLYQGAGAATDDFERQVEQMTDLVLQALPVTDAPALDPAVVATDPNWPMGGQNTSKVDQAKLACVRAYMTAAAYREYKRAAVREYALADRKRFAAGLKLLSSGAAKFLGEYLAQRNEDLRAHRQPRELVDAAARSQVPGVASLVSDERHRSLRTLIGLPSSSGYSADGFFADGLALDAFIEQRKSRCNIPIPRERETVAVKTHVQPPSATETTFAPVCLNPKSVIGTKVVAGARYVIATGATVLPPTEWQVMQCDTHKFFFQQVDRSAVRVDTAMLSDIQVNPWKDEPAFIAEVKDEFAAMDAAAHQQLHVNDIRSVSIDGRPCVDVYRRGTLDVRLPDGTNNGSLVTVELLRACHLRDARGAGAAIVAFYKRAAKEEPQGFDEAAHKFIDSVALPPWVK